MATPAEGVVPAQLGFVAIYNPSLGTTDDTIDDQIVYYASVNTQSQRRRHRSKGRPTDNVSQEERNERLRQIGLAQGMVEFSKSFSGDHPVDTIETEQSRVILHELEPGWWVLASIDLTKLPISATPAGGSANTSSHEPGIEYSSREVKPSALLLQDLLRAHSIFLLHHDSSLSSMFVRSRRSKFTGILGRYWDGFLPTWNVLLHGNPVRSVFGGVKIAACGELGVGVGEEERGSGEREVLEGLVGRIEGLVDLVVSKFGTHDEEPLRKPSIRGDDGTQADNWLGAGNEPGGEDGAIFLGVGALSRHSLRDITYWMEDLYSWGEDAYGVTESPTSTRLPSRRQRKSVTDEREMDTPMKPPTPVTELAKRSKQQPSVDSSASKSAAGPSNLPSDQNQTQAGEAEGHSVDKYVNYLKMGYGTYWSIGGSSTTQAGETGTGKNPHEPHSRGSFQADDSNGRYLIGLMGEVENSDSDTEDSRFSDINKEDRNSRTMLRTLTVELESVGTARTESQITKDFGSHDNEPARQTVGEEGRITERAMPIFDSQDRNKTQKLRVVVYVNKPFMFTFMFQLRTDSLAWDPLYKSLHHQLSPLRKPLANSTAYRPGKPDVGSAAANIFDLIWDPKALTVHSTIPNIPGPGNTLRPGENEVWSRVEALNTHTQILNTYMATRADLSELERTCKTSRGWWVVWSRILERETRPRIIPQTSYESSSQPTSRASSEERETTPTPTQDYTISKEIFLIRKASDHSSSTVRSVSASYVGGGGWADGATRLAQGIGVDTRKYIEGLLSLNR